MVTLKDKKIYINGKPQLILCGEIHYFRLPKDRWQKAIDELKKAGCNAVATYIPWLCHEYRHHDIDLTGRYKEQNDLEGFIKLVEQNDLYFIPRPGPFIMAEVKNEGIPHWVFEEYPDIYPITWDGKKAPNVTCDYLNPDFLCCVEEWYSAVMPLISTHLIQNGGTTIAVQLDNEVGMLAWVSNSPDLTNVVIDGFTEWLGGQYNKDELTTRYGIDITTAEKDYLRTLFRTPTPDTEVALHNDLGYYMRDRFKEYFAVLKQYANRYGVVDVPFIVNIHGSGGERGIRYPIGLSQLYKSYNYSDEFISGSDFYIGNIEIGNFQDIYLANIFTDCLNSKNQPLTSMEFEAGDGNYGDDYERRYNPQAIDKKTRLFIATGNKLLNYYLFSGGENYRLDSIYNDGIDRGDGNNRIAFTGQNHGFAAPLDPYTNENICYDATRQVIQLMAENAKTLATSKLQTDNIYLAFIPDYYMTEYLHPSSTKRAEIIKEITTIRDRGYYSGLARAMVLSNYNFTALDIQNHDITSSITTKSTIAVASSLYLSKEIQQNIKAFMQNGGNVMLYGRMPQYDMEGNSCTILSDYIGVTHKSVSWEQRNYYTSAYPCGAIGNGYPETRVYNVQGVEVSNADVFLRICGSDEVCGFTKQVNNSKIVCLLAEYHPQIGVYNQLFDYLKVTKALSQDYKFHGVFLCTTINEQQERFLHIINLDGYKKQFNVYEYGNPLLPTAIKLEGHESLMLPLSVKVNDKTTVVSSTAELYSHDNNSFTVRLTQRNDIITLDTTKAISPSRYYTITANGDQKTITVNSLQFLADNDTDGFMDIKLI